MPLEAHMIYQIFHMIQMKNVAANMCIDIAEYKAGEPIELYSCHNGGGNQFLAFSEKGLIINYDDKYCIGVAKQNSTTLAATVECADDDISQLWKYNVEVSSRVCFSLAVNLF